MDLYDDKEQLSSKEEAVDFKKELLDFVADDKNKQQAWALAIDIERSIGQKWSTLDRVATKVKLTNEATFQKLKLLEMFGYVVIDKGKGERSRERGQWVFRITLTSNQKIEALQKVIATYREEIDKLELQIKILSASEPIGK